MKNCLFYLCAIRDPKRKVFRQRRIMNVKLLGKKRGNVNLFGTRRKQVAIISALNGFAQLRGFCDNDG